MFSACFRLSTSTSKLPFLVFLIVFGLALIEIIFSMRKGENLARQNSSKDSIVVNLGKSAASFSESDSDRFRLVFLFEHAIYAVYFSLVLRSTTHYGVQLVLGMNRCQFQILSTSQILLLSTRLALRHRLLSPNR